MSHVSLEPEKEKFIKAFMDYVKTLPVETNQVYDYSFKFLLVSNEEIEIAGECLVPIPEPPQ